MDDMNKSAVYTFEELENKKRPELNKLSKLLGIRELSGRNVDLIEKMITKTKTVRCTWNDEGNLVAPKETIIQADGKRIHPVLGEWKKYIVRARESELIDETFANNHFAARIVMNQEVMLPSGFAKFIANACTTREHYYDESKFDPTTGKMGTHTTREIPDFFITEV